ncbi:ATP-binding protein [Herpetosiphon llansteffanensis]|uniref:ATP-binding protein n=1 Tax=Herpetosiphon llansteffanensis TaxID=2094568 RepID=UPI000D7CF46C|nr:tetratricopeptide repeat protein [Herpetosiphon llansteffanensis]
MQHLPQYSTSLIGRSRVVAALADLFQQQAQRLVSLIGASGTGKTRLGLEAAETIRDSFVDGCYFINLAPVDDAVFVLPTIAHALGVHETANQSLLASLIHFLHGKRVLLILDNFEQVKRAANDLNLLIEGTDQAQFMVTSQVALGLANEYAFNVPPLEVPDQANLSASELLEYSAIGLFVDRMQAIQPRFVLSDTQAKAVVEICRLLHGLPLAIELIAAHSSALSPSDLLLLVRNYLALGRGATIAKPSRHHVLYPVLDWCFSRLSAPQQTLFTRMGAFNGGCSSDAVMALYQTAGEFPTAVDAGLASLQQKHLLLQETMPGQQPRYIMLDAVREYAHQRLRKRKEAQQIELYHATYYRDLSASAKEELGGPNNEFWTNRLLSEIHNIRAALQWALSHNQANLALQLSSNLLRFWIRQGYLTEGRRWISTALEQQAKAEPATVRTALGSVGAIAWVQSSYREANAYLESALAIQSSNQHETARLLNTLGLVAYEQGLYEQASAYFEQTLALYRALDDQPMIGITLNNLGLIEIDRGNLAAARQIYAEVLALFRPTNNPFNLILPLSNLGLIEILEERYAEAEPLLEEGLALCRAHRDYNGLGYFLTNLAACLGGQGRFERARECLVEALVVRKTAQSKSGIVAGAKTASEMLLKAGLAEAAALAWGYASAVFAELQAKPVWYDERQQTMIETALTTTLGSEQFESLKHTGAQQSIDELINVLQTATF